MAQLLSPLAEHLEDWKSAKIELQIVGNRSHAEHDGGKLVDLLHGIGDFFEAKDNCDEKFIFAYHQMVVIGAFIGADMGKVTMRSTIEALSSNIKKQGCVRYEPRSIC